MDTVKSFVYGQSTANIVALAVVAGAAGFYEFKMSKMEETLDEEVTPDGETVTEEKPKAPKWKRYGLLALVSIMIVHILIGRMASRPSPSSSFEARMSSAATDLRKTLEDTPDVSPMVEQPHTTPDFQTRVADAAKRLREQIAQTSTKPSPESSASSMAAQASAEISKFISENS